MKGRRRNEREEKKVFFFLHNITKHQNSRASSSCLFLGIAIPPLSPALPGLLKISAVALHASADAIILELSEFWPSGPSAHDRCSPLDCPHPFDRQPSRACGKFLPARASRSRRRNGFGTFWCMRKAPGWNFSPRNFSPRNFSRTVEKFLRSFIH
jgi:hypothetical protein